MASSSFGMEASGVERHVFDEHCLPDVRLIPRSFGLLVSLDMQVNKLKLVAGAYINVTFANSACAACCRCVFCCF